MINKNVDSIVFHQKVSTKRKKLYYSGERYLPILEHPLYGVFELNESDNSFSVPEQYAKILLEASPNLFAVKKSVGLTYKEMSYAELLKTAESRGVKVKSKKKKDLIELLIDSDQEEGLTNGDDEEFREKE